MVAKLRERFTVRKQAAQKFERERFNLRKLNELGVKEKYQIEIRNRIAALENLNGDENVNRAWGNIKENIKTSAKESLVLHEWKQHKPWCFKECVDFLDQKKQAKMQWIQHCSQTIVDNLNNIQGGSNMTGADLCVNKPHKSLSYLNHHVRRNASRHFSKKKGISES